MGDSKGGHSSREDFARPEKALIEFENVAFDKYDFKRIERDEVADPKMSDGVAYRIIIRFNSFPSEQIFSYSTDELRSVKYRALRGKLLANGVMIM